MGAVVFVKIGTPAKCGEPSNWFSAASPKFDRKPSEFGEGIFGRFSNFYNCRPEVSGNVISNAALNHVGIDVLAKLGDCISRLNSGLIIWPAGPV